jgi:hypothetical protein
VFQESLVLAKVNLLKYGAIVIPFSSSLKEEVKRFLVVNGVRHTDANLYGTQADKEQQFSIVNVDLIVEVFPEFITFVDKFAERDSYFHNNITATFRSLLQWWGTEYRRKQDENYWTDKFLEKAFESPTGSLVLADDLRFPNEFDVIICNGGTTIRIDRPDRPQSATSNHPSETSLDDAIFEFYVKNDSTLEEYRKRCRRIIEEIY